MDHRLYINGMSLVALFRGEERNLRVNFKIKADQPPLWDIVFYAHSASQEPCPTFLSQLQDAAQQTAERGFSITAIAYDYTHRLANVPAYHFAMVATQNFVSGGDFRDWVESLLKRAKLETLRIGCESVTYDVMYICNGREISPSQAMNILFFGSCKPATPRS